MAGACLLMILSYAIGHEIKHRQLEICETVCALCSLFEHIAYCVEHTSQSVSRTLSDCSRMQRYSKLEFLNKGLEAADNGAALPDAMLQAFSQDTYCGFLSSDEKRLCTDVLQSICVTARQTQLEHLRTAQTGLQNALRQRREDPRLKGSYYEWMALLGGACAVIILI